MKLFMFKRRTPGPTGSARPASGCQSRPLSFSGASEANRLKALDDTQIALKEL